MLGTVVALSLMLGLAAEPKKEASVSHSKEAGFTVVGVSVRTNNAQEMSGHGKIGELWGRFFSEQLLGQIPHRADADIVAVYTNYASDENGDYTYTLGARVSSVDQLPPGFVRVDVPAGSFAIIPTERGPVQAVLAKTWRRIWAMTGEELGGKRAFSADYEVYGEKARIPNGSQVDIHIRLR
jgi:predicted transcriptional regulator YdeE